MKKLVSLLIIILIFLNWTPIVRAVFLAEEWAGELVYQGTEIPKILPRSTWENSESLKKLLTWYPEENKEIVGPPEYSSIERIIIHDTGCGIGERGCNSKDRDPIEHIQAIYRYQATTKGWGDIGYHYIIDYWGNIYEGRYGGNGVRGAHTYYDRKCDNFNVGTVGILLMGNYENTQLPETMYKSLARLVAWIAYSNSLDPNDLNHYSEIWSAPKNGNVCDISRGSLSSGYTGPVVVGHKDIEAGNPDPGKVDLKRTRQEAGEIIASYKNYLFGTKDNPGVYTIKDGQLREFTLDRSNYTTVNLTRHQFDAFLNPNSKNLLEGSLVKSNTRDRVYLIENGKRRPILSQQLFNLRKYKWTNVIYLSDRDLAVYPLSRALTYPDNVLIKAQAPEVYFVENEKRRHVTSAQLFTNLGFKWKNIIIVSEDELLAHLVGENMLFSEGTLIRGAGPEIYYIKNQKKHWIKTIDVFLKLGFKWRDVIKLSSQELNQYALGTAIALVGDLNKLDQEENIVEEVIAKEPIIKVGIYSAEPNEVFKINANGPYEIYKNGEFLAIKNKDEVFETRLDTKNNFEFIPKTDETIFELLSYRDQPQWNPNLNDNLFRGKVGIKYSDNSKKIWIINEIGLENYLRGLAEALDNHPAEYLKSLIVAARSYAFFHVQNNGKYPQEPFHIRNWSNDQVYKGYGFEKRAPNIVRAVEDTKGVVITYDNKVVRGVYSSDSGGTSKDACKVWAGVFCTEDYDYLRGGIKDPTGTEHIQSAILASHGVGISAVGARVLANQGKTYEEILKYYYPGIEIKRTY